MLQTVTVRFYAGNTDSSDFEALLDRVADGVHARLDGLDPSVGATIGDRFLDVTVCIEAPSPEAAVDVALKTIESALAGIGVWPGPLAFKSLELLEPAEA